MGRIVPGIYRDNLVLTDGRNDKIGGAPESPVANTSNREIRLSYIFDLFDNHASVMTTLRQRFIGLGP
jgi:hypothetical protein